MKKIYLLVIWVGLTITSLAQVDLYVRGDFNSWGTDGGGPLVDDGTNGDAVANDSIFTYTVTMGTTGRYEWKIASEDWSQIFPWAGGDDNAWLITTEDNQDVIFTIDKNVYNDGFEPGFNVVNANDQLPTPTSDIVAAGDFQGWNNAGGTVLYDDGTNGDWVAGDGIYTYYYIEANAGTYSWKPVMSGTWDTWVSAGRTVSSTNLQYITESADEEVFFYLDINTGRVATAVGAPLPVELVSFSASVQKNEIVLLWETASELNNMGFEIERKVDGSDKWVKIGFIEGRGTTTNTSKYSFTDNPEVSNTYFYRLKQMDNDGSFEYSGYVGIEFTKPLEFELGQNYPNPFNPSTTISFSVPEQSKVTLNVYDITGGLVEQVLDENYEAGYYEVNFNANNIPSGTYFYTISASGIENFWQKTGKMLLLK
ncbi:MAG: hypothetical protein SCALA702_32350 [Melioribacteraceae bacterium]|nr:MAG: hypothetical protein SCALA702_32350 [Melioribacteraceae bacterium]